MHRKAKTLGARGKRRTPPQPRPSNTNLLPPSPPFMREPVRVKTHLGRCEDIHRAGISRCKRREEGNTGNSPYLRVHSLAVDSYLALSVL